MSSTQHHHARLHSFDALRAVMMLLGVLLHSTQFYMATSLSIGLSFQDQFTSPACDIILLGIHSFRMQVFFVMAGFFTALLVARRGARGMLRNRMKRVGLPLLFGWFILFPISISAFLYGCALKAGYPPVTGVLTWWQTGRIAWVEDWSLLYNVFLITPWHLWFLYVLIWFYLLSFPVRSIGRLGKGAVGRSAERCFRGLLSRGLLLPAAIAVSFLTLLLSPSGLFPQEFPAFFPNPLALLGFGVFFGFGWLLYGNLDLLGRFERRPYLALAAAALLILFYLGQFEALFDPARAGAAKLKIAAAGAAIAWLCTFGFIGLFLRHFSHPSPRMRYLSDSAYWVYLAHLPLVYWLHCLLFPLQLPGLAKAGLVLLIASVILYLSYDLFVRPYFLGAFLNGRRYPSALLRSRGQSTAQDPDLPLEPAHVPENVMPAGQTSVQ